VRHGQGADTVETRTDHAQLAVERADVGGCLVAGRLALHTHVQLQHSNPATLSGQHERTETSTPSTPTGVGVCRSARCAWGHGSCRALPTPLLSCFYRGLSNTTCIKHKPCCKIFPHLHEGLGEAGVGVAHEAAKHLQHAHGREQRGAVHDVLAQAPQRQRARVERAAACAPK
jgi:hypothetical protein